MGAKEEEYTQHVSQKKEWPKGGVSFSLAKQNSLFALWLVQHVQLEDQMKGFGRVWKGMTKGMEGYGRVQP